MRGVCLLQIVVRCSAGWCHIVNTSARRCLARTCDFMAGATYCASYAVAARCHNHSRRPRCRRCSRAALALLPQIGRRRLHALSAAVAAATGIAWTGPAAVWTAAHSAHATQLASASESRRSSASQKSTLDTGSYRQGEVVVTASGRRCQPLHGRSTQRSGSLPASASSVLYIAKSSADASFFFFGMTSSVK